MTPRTLLPLASGQKSDSNKFKFGLSFFLGMILGVPIAYFALSLFGGHQERSNHLKVKSSSFLNSDHSQKWTMGSFMLTTSSLPETIQTPNLNSTVSGSKSSLLVAFSGRASAFSRTDGSVGRTEDRTLTRAKFLGRSAALGEQVRTRSHSDLPHTSLPARGPPVGPRRSNPTSSPASNASTQNNNTRTKLSTKQTPVLFQTLKNIEINVPFERNENKLLKFPIKEDEPESSLKLQSVALDDSVARKESSSQSFDADNAINDDLLTRALFNSSNRVFNESMMNLTAISQLNISNIVPIGLSNMTEVNETEVSSLNLWSIVEGVYWTLKSESLVPNGFDESDIMEWRRFLNRTQVLKLEDGCGRMQNRLVTLDGGEKSCCRYRHNNDQIQGEIFSFYLGRLLGLRNLAPSALALVDTRTRRWFSAASQVSLAQWSSERPVVLTRFVEGLEPAYIPTHFRNKTQRRLHPVLEDLTPNQDISQLVQWSDLVVFDYLTANLDRTVNNMYNERWNPDMMKQPAHNLAKTPEGLLLFLDNESGLLHGYRLLEKYEHFHRSLLDGLCVFRRSTADAIEQLHRENNVNSALKKAFFRGDPSMEDWLPFLPDKSVKTLKQRITTVHEHIASCKSRFVPTSFSTSTHVSDVPER